MCRHPTIFPIGFYLRHRAHMEKTHHMGMDDFFRTGERNAHPQDRLDFTAFGAWCWRFMREEFHWINCAEESYPADRLKAYWSHGGITPETQSEIESFLT